MENTGLSIKKLSFYLGPLLFLICLILPSNTTLNEAANAVGVSPFLGPKYGLGVLLWTAVWWIFETTSLGLAALVPIILFSISGIMPWKESIAPIMDPLIIVIISGFVFAKAFQKWGLDKRVALTLSSISRTRNPAIAGFFVASLPVFLLTLTGSMTAATSIVYGFVIAFLTRQGFHKGSKYGTGSLLALGQAATSGSLLFLTSTTTNLIAKKVISETTGFELTFFDWFYVGTFHAVFGLFLTWYLVYKIIKPETSSLPFEPSTLKKELAELGPMNRGEKLTISILFLTLLLWLIPGIVTNLALVIPDLESLSLILIKIVPEAAPATLVLFIFPLIKNEDDVLLKWDEMLYNSINWDIVFLVGGGITLGTGLMRSGFSQWIGILFRNVIGPTPNEYMIFAVSSLIGFLLSYPASNTGAASVACPLAASLSIAAGINPIGPILGTAIATTIPSTLPSTTPAMAIAYSSGYIKIKDMVKVGLVADIIRFIVLIIVGPTLVNWFLSLRGLI
ncbi:anion permease [Candidatus Bathyarchaeota archaeon]|nr:anion permease [Candidatus Bathyarchaeota archaeon]